MSHAATNWAIQQRGIRPALKVVLWHLCDRHHPDNGCFPSQDTLAEDCEVSRSALNVYLDELEQRGLIVRERRRVKGSNRQEKTRYYFPFDRDFERLRTENPCPESGHGTEEAESRNPEKPSPENGESRVQNLDSNPVREPVREPVILREGASEREISKSIEKAFWRTIKDWPDFAGMPKDRAKAAWFALTAEERDLAERRRDAWFSLLKAQRKSHVPAPSTYFGEKLFLEVQDHPSEAVKPQLQNPFSRPWMALWLAELTKPMATAWPVLTAFQQMQMRDPAKAADVELERRRKYGWPKAAAMAAEPKPMIVQPQFMTLCEDFQKVHRDSREAAEWKALFDRRGWPWLSTNFEWLYLPPGEPEVAMGEYVNLLNEGKGDDDAA